MDEARKTAAIVILGMLAITWAIAYIALETQRELDICIHLLDPAVSAIPLP